MKIMIVIMLSLFIGSTAHAQTPDCGANLNGTLVVGMTINTSPMNHLIQMVSLSALMLLLPALCSMCLGIQTFNLRI